MKFLIPILVFVTFVLGMVLWLGKKSPDDSNTSSKSATPTPSFVVAPTTDTRKTTPLLNQINVFDPLETRFAPPVFEKLLDLPKE